MIRGSISRRYAKALLSIGIETQHSEEFGVALNTLTDLMTQKELSSVLTNPSLSLTKRKAILLEIIERLKMGSDLRNFLLLLLDRQRLEFIPAIAKDYLSMADEHAGRIRAEVVSAVPLSEGDMTRLKVALEKKTGKQVLLDHKVNSELIAGMVTKLGSVIYDGSLRTKLDLMQQALIGGEQ